MNQIPPEWIRWIDENITRGVPEQTLIETLVHHRFDRSTAVEAVLTRIPGYLVQTRTAQLAKTLAAQPQPEQQQPVQQQPVQQARPGNGYVYEEPMVKPGNTVRIGDHVVEVSMVLERPQVIVFSNVLTKEECEQLIEQSRSKLSRSTTVDDATGKAQVHEHRTSSGTFFHINENPFIAKLDHRIAALMNLPVHNGEGIQILNYQIGGEYKPHFDYFPPDLPGSATHIARGGQRVATLVMYLNDVEEGGETIFPEIGLKVAPRQGCAVYFAYCNSMQQIDPLTYHGGNPVIKGEKWIATKWMRQHQYS
jgi:prolyl 4-hydroxylase